MSWKAVTLEIVLTVIVLSFVGYQYHLSTLDGSKHLSQGDIELVHREYDRALVSFARALEDIQRSKGAWFFAKGMNIDKRLNSVEALHGMGCAYAGLGKYEDANDCLTRVLEFNAFYVHSRSKRAEVLCELGEYEAAVDDFSTILQSAPKARHTYAQRAGAYVRLEQYDKAIADYAQAMELADDGLHDYERMHYANNLAWLLATCPRRELRDGPRAVEMAEPVVTAAEAKFDPVEGAETLAAFKSTLAFAYAQAGRYGDAAATARAALELMDKSGVTDEQKQALRERIEAYEAGRQPQDAEQKVTQGATE